MRLISFHSASQASFPRQLKAIEASHSLVVGEDGLDDRLALRVERPASLAGENLVHPVLDPHVMSDAIGAPPAVGTRPPGDHLVPSTRPVAAQQRVRATERHRDLRRSHFHRHFPSTPALEDLGPTIQLSLVGGGLGVFLTSRDRSPKNQSAS